MSLKPSDIDYITNLLTQITETLTKTDDYLWPQDLKDKLLLSMEKQKYVNSTIKPLQKKLDLYLTPRWPEILLLSDQRQFKQDIELFLNSEDINNFRREKTDYLDDSSLKNKKEKVVDELQRIQTKLEYQREEAKQKAGGKAGVKLIENKPFDQKEDLDVLKAIDEWKITVQPHIEDLGVSDVSPDAYSLTQKIVTWCDAHSSIDAGIFWEVYRQITACRKPEPEGYIGHRKSPEIMRDTYRKAIDVCNRIVGFIKNSQAKREAEQKNKVVQGEQEGFLEPKPPELLQNLLWVFKYGRKHWRIILLAMFLLFIWGNFVWPKFDLFSKFYHPKKKAIINDYGRTPLYARTEKRVYDIYEKIENEKLNPWIFINAGVKIQITEYNGKVISYEGVTFEGTPRLVFWSDDFIPPFIEDAIIKVFDQTIEECRKNNLDPEPYISEAKSLLYGFINKVYSRMAYIDQKLSSKDGSTKVGLKDVSFQIDKMNERLKKHYDAAILMVSKDGSTNKNLHQQSNDSTDKKWYETIPSKIAGWVIFFAALLTIFYYLGWLDPIKEFIRSILRPK